jgi:hypothetical protein
LALAFTSATERCVKPGQRTVVFSSFIERPSHAMMSLLGSFMHTIAILLIVCGSMFNCYAIAFLLLEKRKADLQKKIFQQNLEGIEYYLHQARRAKIAGG